MHVQIQRGMYTLPDVQFGTVSEDGASQPVPKSLCLTPGTVQRAQ
jgi:hypothetical protein